MVNLLSKVGIHTKENLTIKLMNATLGFFVENVKTAVSEYQTSKEDQLS
jgi:hypothetical protein